MWQAIRQTPQYREARREVEELIKNAVKPLELKIDEMAATIAALEKKVAALEARPAL
jgi:hypothetical protein